MLFPPRHRLVNNCRRYRVFRKYVRKIKSKTKNENNRVPLLMHCFFFFSEPSAFRTAQTRRPIEKTNIVSKFEAVYCTMLNCTRKHPHADNGHTAILTQCNRCIRTEFICNVTATTQNRIEWMHLHTRRVRAEAQTETNVTRTKLKKKKKTNSNCLCGGEWFVLHSRRQLHGSR